MRLPDGFAEYWDGSGRPEAVGGAPNVARVYDFLLGGKDNFFSDRASGERLLGVLPGAMKAARANRDFMIRTVRFLASEAGIRQFLDLGTGYPAHTNVHDVALAISPDSRVAYVDNDPVVVAHANALLADAGRVTAVHGDLRLPDDLLDLPAVRNVIDFDEPVAVLMAAVLHFVEDYEEPWLLADYFKTRMAEGSYLVISHATSDYLPSDTVKAAEEICQDASAPCTFRAFGEIARFFDGLEIVPPGLINVAGWRPALPARRPHQALALGGIGRKPAAMAVPA